MDSHKIDTSVIKVRVGHKFETNSVFLEGVKDELCIVRKNNHEYPEINAKREVSLRRKIIAKIPETRESMEIYVLCRRC